MNALVIVPTYNERENLPVIVEAVLAHDDLKVLVVDDHSPDGTGEVADELEGRFAGRVSVLHRTGPRGLGRSYLAGFSCALSGDSDVICQLDADLSHDPSYLPRMLAELENSDLVIGSRYVQGGAIENWPVRRRLLSAAANRYVRTITGLAVHDCTSGYRCWGRSLVDRLPLEDIESDGYSFLVEMLCLAVEHGCRVGEVPITFVERRLGRSKLSTKVLGESIVTPWRFVRGGRRWSGRRVGPSRGIRG